MSSTAVADAVKGHGLVSAEDCVKMLGAMLTDGRHQAHQRFMNAIKHRSKLKLLRHNTVISFTFIYSFIRLIVFVSGMFRNLRSDKIVITAVHRTE